MAYITICLGGDIMDKEYRSKRPKKDHGSGSITQRKDKTWTARIQIGNKQNGKPNIKAFYGKTEAEVKRKLKNFKQEIQKNDFIVVQKTTVQQYMGNWLITVKKNTLKPKSYDRLETTLKYQIYPYIGNLQISALTSDDVQTMINQLRDEGKSYSTIKKAYDAVNECFRTGIIKKSVITNPALGVTLPSNIKKRSSDIKYFTKDEIDRLIPVATSIYQNGNSVFRLGYIIPFGLHTGLRIGEILGLKWANVDMDNMTATVTDTLAVVKNRDKDAETKYKLIEQTSTKSISGQRTIELNSIAYNALLQIKEITGEGIYVFESKNKKPITPKNMDRLIRNAEVRAQFPEDRMLGFHALRHTFASMLFAKGADVKTVSEALGHSSVKITYDIYIHLINDQQKKAVKAIEDF